MKVVGKVKDKGVTIPAILIGLILIPISNLWITVIEVRWYALDGTCLPLFITPVFIFFMLIILNSLVRKLTGGGLRRGELLTVYMMVVMAATLASHDLVQNMFGTISYPKWMASDSNHYQQLFFKYMPSHMFVTDKTALTGLFKGNASPWTCVGHWLGPLAMWGALLMVLIGMMMCMNIIIRKQWTVNEKLVFPLVQLPIAMAAEDSGAKFYSDKLMWAGFGIAFAIGLINGLHALYPAMPVLLGVKEYNLAPLITSHPWNALGLGIHGLTIATYPFAIGLAYFMPLDLSFSCWFFYVAGKAWQVFGSAAGWETTNTGFPYYDAQSSGAWIALGLMIVVGSLPYLKGVWRQAWHTNDMSPEEEGEAELYRSAFIGLAIGAGLLLLFTTYMGLWGPMALVFFVIYFLLAITITRVRAELGTPHEIYFVNPQQIMLSIFGYSFIGPMNLTLLSTMYWFNRGYRSHPMPNQLEAFKMAEGTAIKIKPLALALLLAALVGLLSSYWANLTVTYHAGAHAKCMGFKYWVGAESFNRLANWMHTKPTPDTIRIAYMLVGAAMVVCLKSVRGAFVAWPFHPAGYALAISYAMDYFWFAFFISWLVKLVILHCGGMRLHNKCVPFFLGLVLGDFCIGSIWAIVGPLIGQQAYRIFI